jgi:AraC-like DNA-binding protein
LDLMESMAGTREPGGVRAWRCADLGGLELFRASVSQFTFRPHAHGEYFIALTESGLATPAYRGDRRAIGPGDMIVLNPEEGHAGGPPPGSSWTYRALYVPEDLMRQAMTELAPPAPSGFTADVIRDPHIAALLLRFHNLSESPGSSPLQREACLAEGLTLLASRYAGSPRPPRQPGREPRAVRLAREFLHEHAADTVTLRDLARHTGITPSHLCRVFRQATGMTPHDYQVHIRVRNARTLLLAGCPIAQAAAETGFWDQAHLTRHFKRTMGLTPGRYLANLARSLLKGFYHNGSGTPTPETHLAHQGGM